MKRKSKIIKIVREGPRTREKEKEETEGRQNVDGVGCEECRTMTLI